MLNNTLERLEYLCDTIPELVSYIPEEDFSFKPGPGKWSRKEILGHLIDSATNNHQRFVRIQFEDIPHIVYDQDRWNESNHYQEMKSRHLISFWEIYNRHLHEVVRRIPVEKLSRQCLTSGPQPVTLGWLFEDYVAHMEHHLRQIVAYK